jgi:uncharacterized membrane protein (DUF106 family)
VAALKQELANSTLAFEATIAEQAATIARLQDEMRELQTTADTAVLERDFILSKLQEIETAFQDNEHDADLLRSKFRDILYVPAARPRYASHY